MKPTFKVMRGDISQGMQEVMIGMVELAVLIVMVVVVALVGRN